MQISLVSWIKKSFDIWQRWVFVRPYENVGEIKRPIHHSHFAWFGRFMSFHVVSEDPSALMVSMDLDQESFSLFFHIHSLRLLR